MAFYEDLAAKTLHQRIDHYLEQTGLTARANEALKKYSGQTRQ
jgi:ABC-type multidrug transport system ATPase subunit